MLKKKRKESEVPESPEELLDELQTVNEARVQDMEEELEPEADAEPAVAQPSAEDKLRDELAQANDKYLRLYAEFDNFRRRTSKERIELHQTAGKEVITAMLPVLDDFDRALRAMEAATDVIPVKEGVALVQNKFKNILVAKGLKAMETKGQVFDADLHEAITSIPAGDAMKGKVVDELEKGYYLNDKVVRFAKVVVGA